MRFFGRRPPDIVVDVNPAQDDVELRQAAGKACGGDWGPARDLLTALRHDYDRRARVVQVLAESTAGDGQPAWPDRWAGADPVNPDALLVRARSLIVRGRRTGGDEFHRLLRKAVLLGDEAAVLAPDDPTPWAQRLTLMTVLGADGDTFEHGWAELTARDPWHREGHGCKLTYLCRRWRGSHERMFAFAREIAHAAPAGSPLRVLPLHAADEWALWETHHGADGGTMRQALSVIHTQREDPRFHAEVRAALELWFARPAYRHGLWFHDLNRLAHALHRAGQHQQARPVFAAIGAYFEDGPWSYAGGEPAFQQARRKALTAATR
ncbi:hypothetical protein FB565_008038 [Actinoplanes lutulentus]|uniref:DUF4034 domain-containing protein n=1 Tax=Actinoplanes lutulentus TaxID=1287878 RepID=UPI0017D0D93A|nr:DUF4034 domain-containing protein [Actinoplanes lutulentus]MBB2948255.1 hypothetical protein [Actinoplanes lutulentus]